MDEPEPVPTPTLSRARLGEVCHTFFGAFGLWLEVARAGTGTGVEGQYAQ